MLDFGGGATGFLTDRVGLNWDVRYFRSVGGEEGTGLTFGKEQISFWRATMGVAIRAGSGAMTRRQLLCATLALVGALQVVGAEEHLRIVPLVHEKQMVVTLEIADAYTSDVREAISSGLRTTFTYDVELRMVVAGWVDRTIATSVVSISVQYDNLTRRHSLSRTVDGRIDEAVVTEDEEVVAKWLTSVERLPLVLDREARTESRILRPRQRPQAPAAHLPVRLDRPDQRPGQVHVHPVSQFVAVARWAACAELCAAANIRGFRGFHGIPGR